MGAISVGDLEATFRIRNEGGATLQRIGKDLQAFEGTLQRTGGSLTSVGRTLTAGITLPLVAVGGLAIKAASDFESSFAGVRKTVEATEAQFAALSSGLREMAQQIPVNVNELNRIAESAGQLGIAQENVLGFTRVMADLGVTTNLAGDEAATAFARFANITGASQKSFDRMGSAVVELGNNFATTEAEIVNFALRIAGAGKLAGVTDPQIFALGAAFTSVGVRAEEGGTSVQRVLLGMKEAVAGGGAQLEIFARTAQMSATEFADAFRSNAGAAFTEFVEGLGQQGIAAAQTLRDLNFQDQALIKSFLSLAAAGKLTENAMRAATQAYAANTALATEAAKRYATFASELIKLKARVQEAAITIGTALLPSVHDLMDVVAPLVDRLQGAAQWFAQLPSPVRTTALAMAGLAAAVGPMMAGLGLLALGIAPMAGMLGGVASAAGALGLTLGPIAAIVGGVAAVLVLMAAEATAVAVAIRLLTGSWEFLTGPMGQAAQLLKEVGALAVVVAVEGFHGLTTAIRGLVGAIDSLAGPLGGLGTVIQHTMTSIQIAIAMARLATKQARDIVETATAPSRARRELSDITPGAPTIFQAAPTPDYGQAMSDAAKTANALYELERASAAATAGFGGQTAASENLQTTLARARAELGELSAADRATIAAGLELERGLDKIAAAAGISEDALRLYVTGLEQSREATKALTEAMSQIIGVDAIGSAEALAAALRDIPTHLIDPSQLEGLIDDLVAGQRAADRMGRELVGVDRQLSRLGLSPAIARDLRDIHQRIEGTHQAVTKLPKPFDDFANIVSSAVDPLVLTEDAATRLGYALEELPDDARAIEVAMQADARAAEVFRTSIRDLSTAFADLADVSGGTLGGIAADVGKVIGAMGLGVEAGASLKGGWQALGQATNVQQQAAAWTQMGAAAASGAAAVAAATDVAGRGNRALGGGLTGAAIGAQFVPVAGAVVGFAVGAIVGALRNPAWEQAAKRVAHRTGIEISEELARGIEAEADLHYAGSLWAAEVANLGAIIAEGGGLTVANVETMLGELRSAFSMEEMGDITGGQLRQILEKNFGVFAEYVSNSTDLAAEGFAEILQLAHRFGATTAEMSQFVGEQTATIGAGIAAMAAASKQTQADFHRLGTVALSSFNAAIAGGGNFLQVMQGLAPGLQALTALQEHLGITGENAALRQLLRFQELATAFPLLIQGAAALNETMVALSTIGALDAETLRAMEVQGLRTFTALRDAGFSEVQALMQMQGFLQNVQEAHARLGTPIGANVQKMLDLAAKHGLLKAEGQSMTDVLQSGFESVVQSVDRLTSALGGEVPAAANQAAAAINRIPRRIDIEVNQRYTQSGTPVAGGGNRPAQPRPEARAQHGLIVRGPTTVLAGEAGPEAIVPLAGLARRPSRQTIIVQVDGREIAEAVVDHAPDVLSQLGIGT